MGDNPISELLNAVSPLFFPKKLGDQEVVRTPRDRLNVGEKLHCSQSLVSEGGQYRLEMVGPGDETGNLVLYGPGNRRIWSSGTGGQTASYAQIGADGSIDIVKIGYGPPPQYQVTPVKIWSTQAGDSGAAYLKLEKDGSLVAYDRDGQLVERIVRPDTGKTSPWDDLYAPLEASPKLRSLVIDANQTLKGLWYQLGAIESRPVVPSAASTKPVIPGGAPGAGDTGNGAQAAGDATAKAGSATTILDTETKKVALLTDKAMNLVLDTKDMVKKDVAGLRSEIRKGIPATLGSASLEEAAERGLMDAVPMTIKSVEKRVTQLTADLAKLAGDVPKPPPTTPVKPGDGEDNGGGGDSGYVPGSGIDYSGLFGANANTANTANTAASALSSTLFGELRKALSAGATESSLRNAAGGAGSAMEQAVLSSLLSKQDAYSLRAQSQNSEQVRAAEVRRTKKERERSEAALALGPKPGATAPGDGTPPPPPADQAGSPPAATLASAPSGEDLVAVDPSRAPEEGGLRNGDLAKYANGTAEVLIENGVVYVLVGNGRHQVDSTTSPTGEQGSYGEFLGFFRPRTTASLSGSEPTGAAPPARA
ncbi:hypothetical protein [Nocardia sp. NPDC051832]|uniref:hypothetical protein n=1 Tax=Nocardia sp. NPDC051832 TaxID=3155673 RepID=UPI0034377500